MTRGLVVTASVALALAALVAWTDPFRPEADQAPPAARFDAFGRLIAYAGKEEAACPPQDARTAVIFAIGQSNVANFGAARLASAHGARVVNFFDGSCWVARSPLYGADQTFGEPLTPLGDGLIANGAADRVVLAVAAIGGRPIAHFAREDLRPMLEAAIASLAARYRPTAIIWHQGESDLALGTSADSYKRDFGAIVARLRAQWPDAPILVSVSTKCLPMFPGWRADNAIAQAQRELVDPARRILAGVDTDALFSEADRSDACHMSRSGQEKFAAAYAGLVAKASTAGGQVSSEPFRASAAPAR